MNNNRYHQILGRNCPGVSFGASPCYSLAIVGDMTFYRTGGPADAFMGFGRDASCQENFWKVLGGREPPKIWAGPLGKRKGPPAGLSKPTWDRSRLSCEWLGGAYILGRSYPSSLWTGFQGRSYPSTYLEYVFSPGTLLCSNLCVFLHFFHPWSSKHWINLKELGLRTKMPGSIHFCFSLFYCSHETYRYFFSNLPTLKRGFGTDNQTVICMNHLNLWLGNVNLVICLKIRLDWSDKSNTASLQLVPCTINRMNASWLILPPNTSFYSFILDANVEQAHFPRVFSRWMGNKIEKSRLFFWSPVSKGTQTFAQRNSLTTNVFDYTVNGTYLETGNWSSLSFFTVVQKYWNVVVWNVVDTRHVRHADKWGLQTKMGKRTKFPMNIQQLQRPQKVSEGTSKVCKLHENLFPPIHGWKRISNQCCHIRNQPRTPERHGSSVGVSCSALLGTFEPNVHSFVSANTSKSKILGEFWVPFRKKNQTRIVREQLASSQQQVWKARSACDICTFLRHVIVGICVPSHRLVTCRAAPKQLHFTVQLLIWEPDWFVYLYCTAKRANHFSDGLSLLKAHRVPISRWALESLHCVMQCDFRRHTNGSKTLYEVRTRIYWGVVTGIFVLSTSRQPVINVMFCFEGKLFKLIHSATKNDHFCAMSL